MVAFGDDGVWTAPGQRRRHLPLPRFVVDDLGFDAGGWRVDRHPRFVADLTGFGNDGPG
ncbi:hypothetical protein ACWT_5307 [Actinoplanes sp. SE50]|uniref:hypothetical protein n=1 Tax=unclassified Actinoplanes TaxID=2626549 RepID=UPI00023EC13A|nr:MULTISPECIES: hypothetical protein [unclassified Actinoplanes]AEV86325.1 hypothetical protein ACPL_5438 [Actinoplanes sp. SE50/110]ATO84722.1 hypothetical protein ACWT_5307 [Actinoplanes sp. SE50]SLM02132.1 hypothetical protein ACSP50_5370 [Actinoplanes sp. SE50/110]